MAPRPELHKEPGKWLRRLIVALCISPREEWVDDRVSVKPG